MTVAEERLTWDEIVNKYPDRWVALKDCEMEEKILVISAVVCGVCEDRYKYDLEVKLNKEKISHIWRRTTDIEGAFVF